MSIQKTLAKNVADSTAMAGVCNPILGFFENVVLGFSDELTLGSRISGTLLQYLGVGFVYAKGREISHRVLKIEEGSLKEKIYDAAYGEIFSSTMGAAILAGNGATAEEIGYGAVMNAGMGLVLGAPVGYAIDVFRDLCGIHEAKRTPACVKNFGRRAKLGVAAASIAISAGLVGTTLAATPEGYRGVKGYLEGIVCDAACEAPQILYTLPNDSGQ